MEDAIPADMQEGFRLVRQHTVTPLAVGEVFNSVHDCHTLITEQLIDYIRMTIVHGGGIPPLLKLANLPALNHVRTGFHGPTDLSPANMAAPLPFAPAIYNFAILQPTPS